MKVHIKKPVSFFGVYHLADLLSFVGFSEETCEKVGDYLGNNKNLVNFFEWVYKVRQDKNKIIIENFDTWNVDYTLSLIILPLLKKFKETERFGIPMLEEFDNLSEEERQNAWEDILDKMIWSFENILNEDIEQFYENKPTYENCKDVEDLCTMIEKCSSKFDREGYLEYHEKIQKGLNLFGKHFRQLWD